jgi:hypothetical protein
MHGHAKELHYAPPHIVQYRQIHVMTAGGLSKDRRFVKWIKKELGKSEWFRKQEKKREDKKSKRQA